MKEQLPSCEYQKLKDLHDEYFPMTQLNHMYKCVKIDDNGKCYYSEFILNKHKKYMEAFDDVIYLEESRNNEVTVEKIKKLKKLINTSFMDRLDVYIDCKKSIDSGVDEKVWNFLRELGSEGFDREYQPRIKVE